MKKIIQVTSKTLIAQYKLYDYSKKYGSLSFSLAGIPSQAKINSAILVVNYQQTGTQQAVRPQYIRVDIRGSNYIIDNYTPAQGNIDWVSGQINTRTIEIQSAGDLQEIQNNLGKDITFHFNYSKGNIANQVTNWCYLYATPKDGKAAAQLVIDYTPPDIKGIVVYKAPSGGNILMADIRLDNDSSGFFTSGLDIDVKVGDKVLSSTTSSVFSTNDSSYPYGITITVPGNYNNTKYLSSQRTNVYIQLTGKYNGAAAASAVISKYYNGDNIQAVLNDTYHGPRIGCTITIPSSDLFNGNVVQGVTRYNLNCTFKPYDDNDTNSVANTYSVRINGQQVATKSTYTYYAKAGNNSFTIQVTDGRGCKTTITTSHPKSNGYAYTKPSFNSCQAYRWNQYSNVKDLVNGTAFRISWDVKTSSSSIAGITPSVKQVYVDVQGVSINKNSYTNKTDSVTITRYQGVFEKNKSYLITVTATDTLNQTCQTVITLPSGRVFMKWDPARMSFSFGEQAEQNSQFYIGSNMTLNTAGNIDAKGVVRLIASNVSIKDGTMWKTLQKYVQDKSSGNSGSSSGALDSTIMQVISTASSDAAAAKSKADYMLDDSKKLTSDMKTLINSYISQIGGINTGNTPSTQPQCSYTDSEKNKVASAYNAYTAMKTIYATNSDGTFNTNFTTDFTNKIKNLVPSSSTGSTGSSGGSCNYTAQQAQKVSNAVSMASSANTTATQAKNTANDIKNKIYNADGETFTINFKKAIQQISGGSSGGQTIQFVNKKGYQLSYTQGESLKSYGVVNKNIGVYLTNEVGDKTPSSIVLLRATAKTNSQDLILATCGATDYIQQTKVAYFNYSLYNLTNKQVALYNNGTIQLQAMIIY